MFNIEACHSFWTQSDEMIVIYTVIFNLTGVLIPMLSQLSALIFGYIRHNKKSSDLNTSRPKYITYFDPIVEDYIVTYAAFLQQEEE